MINNILGDYKEAYSFKNNYLKYFSKKSIIFSIVIIILGILAIIITSYIYQISWPMIFLGAPLFFCLPIMKNEINRVVKEKYKCKKRYEVSKLFKLEFEKKLRIRHIETNNIDQLDYLIALIEQNLSESKPRLYIKSGIFVGFLGPLWISYLNTIFKYTTNIEEATYLFFLIITILFFICILYIAIKYGFVDDFLYSDYYKLKLLRNLMKDYRLINMNKKFSDIA